MPELVAGQALPIQRQLAVFLHQTVALVQVPRQPV